MSSASDVPAFPLNLCGNTAKPEPFRPMGVSEEVRANYSGRIITRVTKAAALRRLRSAARGRRRGLRKIFRRSRRKVLLHRQDSELR